MNPDVFTLKPQGRALSVITVVVLYVFVAVMGAIFGVLPAVATKNDVAVLAGLGVGALVGCAALFLLLRRFNRPKRPPPVEVSATTLSVPRSLRDERAVQIPLADVRSIEARGQRGRTLLVINTTGGFHIFPLRAFVEEDAGPRIRRAVRDNLARLPDGPALLAEMDAREQGGVAATRRKTPATFALLGIIAVLFAVEAAMGLTNPLTLVRLGANSPALVDEGQWWRLFTAAFLHLSVLHILLNGSVLVNLGTALEKIVGSPRLVVIVLVSAFGGNVASMVTRSHTYSAGASAFVFGLIGALLVVNLRHGKSLPGGFNLGARRWATLLGVNAVISLLPGVDGLAHLGGLIAGAGAAFLLVPELDIDPPKRHPAAVALAGLLAVVFAAAFGVMGARAAGLVEADHEGDLTMALRATQKPTVP